MLSFVYVPKNKKNCQLKKLVINNLKKIIINNINIILFSNNIIMYISKYYSKRLIRYKKVTLCLNKPYHNIENELLFHFQITIIKLINRFHISRKQCN